MKNFYSYFKFSLKIISTINVLFKAIYYFWNKKIIVEQKGLFLEQKNLCPNKKIIIEQKGLFLEQIVKKSFFLNFVILLSKYFQTKIFLTHTNFEL